MLSRASDRLVAALKTLLPKPPDTADRSVKQKYSQKFSETVAVCFAEELRSEDRARLARRYEEFTRAS